MSQIELQQGLNEAYDTIGPQHRVEATGSSRHVHGEAVITALLAARSLGRWSQQGATFLPLGAESKLIYKAAPVDKRHIGFDFAIDKLTSSPGLANSRSYAVSIYTSSDQHTDPAGGCHFDLEKSGNTTVFEMETVEDGGLRWMKTICWWAVAADEEYIDPGNMIITHEIGSSLPADEEGRLDYHVVDRFTCQSEDDIVSFHRYVELRDKSDSKLETVAHFTSDVDIKGVLLGDKPIIYANARPDTSNGVFLPTSDELVNSAIYEMGYLRRLRRFVAANGYNLNSFIAQIKS